MEFSEAYSTIKTRIDTQWAILHATIPLVYPNEIGHEFDVYSTFVHVEIRGGHANIVAFGGPSANRQRQSGEVIFRIFTPADGGMSTALDLSDDLCGILRCWSSGNLRIFGAAPTTGGDEDRSGNFFELDVIASFFFDTIG